MTISPIAGDAQLAATRALLGTDLIGVDRNTLLQQCLIAMANRSGGGGGTVTTLTASDGLLTISNPTTTPDIGVAGTSGGIPYFNSATSWASSAALAANALMIGGGAGAAPTTVTTGANVLTALGVAVGSAGAIVVNGGALGTPSSGTLTNCTGLPAAGVSAGTLSGLFTFNRLVTITQGTANEGIITSTGYSLTGSNATSMIDLAGTWNTSGTPTAIKLNVTNTASNSASLLMDLQVGGTSRFKVDVGGEAFINASGSVPLSVAGQFGSFTVGIGGGSLVALNGGSGFSVNCSSTIFLQTAGVTTATLIGASSGVLQLGSDAAGVTNQRLTAANRITSDGVGANLTIAPGNGRGGAGGSLILSTYTTAGAATAGTLTTRMTIDTLGAITCAGNIVTAASTTTIAGLNIPSGTAPSSPVSGDIWYDGTNLRFRDGGTTRVITWT